MERIRIVVKNTIQKIAGLSIVMQVFCCIIEYTITNTMNNGFLEMEGTSMISAFNNLQEDIESIEQVENQVIAMLDVQISSHTETESKVKFELIFKKQSLNIPTKWLFAVEQMNEYASEKIVEAIEEFEQDCPLWVPEITVYDVSAPTIFDEVMNGEFCIDGNPPTLEFCAYVDQYAPGIFNPIYDADVTRTYSDGLIHFEIAKQIVNNNAPPPHLGVGGWFLVGSSIEYHIIDQEPGGPILTASTHMSHTKTVYAAGYSYCYE